MLRDADEEQQLQQGSHKSVELISWHLDSFEKVLGSLGFSSLIHSFCALFLFVHFLCVFVPLFSRTGFLLGEFSFNLQHFVRCFLVCAYYFRDIRGS